MVTKQLLVGICLIFLMYSAAEGHEEKNGAQRQNQRAFLSVTTADNTNHLMIPQVALFTALSSNIA